ncbi:unnamed protein product [Notodromas monacha]|uniref:Rieske domain-containing protein n=1 Tax=Notodromas monacha TaxID=399045 RepID=A0A7R9BEY3_9CRUS|nr:unnamed protein product [Notodromas monacha]CAG0912873.1 unnamed protein product [Notodromas monacha]
MPCFPKRFVSAFRRGLTMAPASSDTLEVKIPLTKLPDGELKEVPMGDQNILMIREGSTVRAFGSKCTHYGAPLIKGIHANGRVRCPWHGACFNLTTGDIEDFPGLDSLPCYDVTVDGDTVTVTAQKGQLENTKRIRTAAKYEPNSPKSDDVVILGGGAAGATCAENLRYQGHKGLIIIVSQDANPPYDRPKLSKALDSTFDAIKLRSPDFYEDHGIKVMTKQRVLELLPDNNTVTLQNIEEGSTWSLDYGKLVIATGARPRKLDIPGSELKNIFYLRSIEDAQGIAAAGAGKNVVVIGSSFIGMEVAAYFCSNKKAKSVTIIGATNYPYERVLGQKIGERIQKLFHESSDLVRFVNGSHGGVKEFVPSSGPGSDQQSLDEAELGRVVLADGETIVADVCVVGIGVEPSTSFVSGSGIKLDDRGFVIVDEFGVTHEKNDINHIRMMRTNVKGIYAAGDVTRFPLKFGGSNGFKDNVSIGHWGLAMKLGEAAAASICNPEAGPRATVPFFWSVIFGKSLRYSGYCPDYDDVIIGGSLQDLSFVAYFCKGSRVNAVATLNKDPVAAKFAEWLYAGHYLEKSRVQRDPMEWLQEPIDSKLP